MTLSRPYIRTKPSSVTEWKQFYKEQWARIPPQWQNTFVSFYKYLMVVISAKVALVSNHIDLVDNCFFTHGQIGLGTFFLLMNAIII